MRRVAGAVLIGAALAAGVFLGYRAYRGYRFTGTPEPGEAAPAPGATAAEGVRNVPENAPPLRIAAFNVQVLGRKKASNPRVMEVLARVAREFDLLAVQEIRDAREEVADLLLDRINAEPGPAYVLHEGPRLGRTANTEQYALYYLPGRLRLERAEVLPDPYDAFEREPLLARFQAGGFDFLLLVIHVKPDDARRELAALAQAALAVLAAEPAERDLIIIGDLNADCAYFSEGDSSHLLRSPTFRWVIGDGMDTNLAPTECAYDRIILLDATYLREYVPDSAGAFRFDLEYGLPPDLAREVSDHYPVLAEFRADLPDDD